MRTGINAPTSASPISSLALRDRRRGVPSPPATGRAFGVVTMRHSTVASAGAGARPYLAVVSSHCSAERRSLKGWMWQTSSAKIPIIRSTP
jgi:hypothetical protein